jgi:hypothetical protein
MRGRYRRSILAALFAGSLATGCHDLDTTNYNEPDRERALSDAGDVGSLISATYNTWYKAVYGTDGNSPGLFMSNQAFQHSSPWANAGMEIYGRIPRVKLENDPLHGQYGPLSWAWDRSYRALSALANGFASLEDPEVADQLSPQEEVLLRAYGRFVQGLAHGTVALLYDRGIVLDETTDLNDPLLPVDYATLMEAALGYLEETIAIASTSSFTIPFEWILADDLTSQELVRVAHSYRARFRAQVARTAVERAAVDWDAVIADVEAGIQSTFFLVEDWNAGWWNAFLDWATWYANGQLPYFSYGMADQSGNVAEWLALPIEEKAHKFADGRPVLIVTPDLRFPQGSTVEEQRANEGVYIRIAGEDEESGGLSSWKKPERGTWRWSWYKDVYGYWDMDQPEIQRAEMRLLKAEALYRKGDLAGAAAVVNETRIAAGLSPTDAAGTNADCVPRLPNGTCGDLWEMLKWEKRMETMWTGVAGVNWFFDGRGWGDLWKDTPLQLPVPCEEIELLKLLPCNTFGGPGGVMSAPVSTYDFPFER